MISVLVAVTGGSIAHTLRPLPIALELRQRGMRVVFGGRGPYMRFLIEQGFPVVPLPMLDYARVIKMMDSERFHLYGVSDYRSTVSHQRDYLEALRPDLVLQDGPDSSLPVAAYEAGIKHVNIANATVFGLTGPQRIVPFRPLLRKMVRRSDRWTQRVNDFLVLQRNIRISLPVNMYLLRRGITLTQIQQNVLLPDLPELFNAPTNIVGKVFIGPLLYEPDVPLPSWWKKMLDDSRRLIYVGVGSSGGATGMRIIIKALADSVYKVVFSTADAFEAKDLPSNFYASRLVPRQAVLRHAAAMVYHGGSATTYQAIRNAVPMVAIPSHFDHDMNARAVEAQGLGVSIFPHELSVERLRNAVDQVVDSSDVGLNLKRFQFLLARRRAPEQAADLLLAFAKPTKKSQNSETTTGWLLGSSIAMEEVGCLLCGEMKNEKVREVEDTILGGKQVYSIVRCKNCGMDYCSPRPNQTGRWLLEPLEQESRMEFRTMLRLSKINLQSRVLIAGCGSGHFAQYLLERIGCETICVEEHPALVKRARARGLWVRNGTLTDLPGEDSGFNAILFFDSLERALSPKSELESARKRLVTGGLVVIRSADGSRSDAAMDAPRALYSFTTNTIDAILRRTGYTGIRHRKGRQGKHIFTVAIPEIQ